MQKNQAKGLTDVVKEDAREGGKEEVGYGVAPASKKN